MMIPASVMDSLAVSWRRAERLLGLANLPGGHPASRLLAMSALDGYFALVDFVLDDVNRRLESGVADR